jgi:Na+/proline symporter
MSSSQTVWSVLGGIALVLLAIGLWTLRRVRSGADFRPTNALGVVRCGLSGAASAYSFWVTVGVTGAAFTLGWSALWLAIGVLLGAAFAWFIAGPRVKRAASAAGTGTALELAGGAGEGSGAATLSVTSLAAVAALFGIVAQLGFIGAVVAHDLGTSTAIGVALVAALALIAPVLGGLRATSSAGVVCALIALPAAVLLPMVGLIFIGPLDALRVALATTGDSAAALFGGRSELDVAVLLLGAAGLGVGICGQPQVLDQFIAARSERSLRVSGVLAVLWLAFVLAGALVLGWVARVDYSSIANPDDVMFEVARRAMPPGFVALPILAVLGLVICSVGNQLVALVHAALNLNRSGDGPGASAGRLRVVVLVAGLAAAAIAGVSGVGSSRGYLLAWLALSALVGPLVLLSSYGVRVRPAWAAGAARAAIALTLILFLLRRERLIEIAMFLPFYLALLIALLGRRRES